jgi:uncharacterized membrane protein
MSGQETGEEEFISKNRLEALIDGIFAFAMTLLVLSLAVPVIPSAQAAEKLPDILIGMGPAFLSFIIAFFVLARFWMAHHRYFLLLKTIDKNLLWLNLIALMGIVFVPFSTDLSGDYSGVPVAVELFHINLLFIGVLFAVQWHYISKRPALTIRKIEERETRCMTARSLVLPVVAVTGIVLTPFIFGWSMLVYLASRPGMILVTRRCRETSIDERKQ